MKTWPEFVTDAHQAHRVPLRVGELTGWETVVFELAEASPGEEDIVIIEPGAKDAGRCRSG